jgi:hypothetical protein
MEPSILVADSGAQLRWQESGLLAVCEVCVEDMLGVEVDDRTLVVHHYPPVEVCAAGLKHAARVLPGLTCVIACPSSAVSPPGAAAAPARAGTGS